MGLAPDPGLAALAFCGAAAVYAVDRLRDLERDRETAPRRTAFVARHRRSLTALAAGAAFAAGGLALREGPAVAAVAAGVASLGFAHRRLKRHLWAKPVYLTGAWTAVAVGLPAAAGGPAPGRALAVAAVVAPTVLANVALSNLRDGEGAAGRLGRRRARVLAAGLLVPAAAAAWAAGPGPRSLLPLPGAMALAVAAFQPGERYGLWVVDGALLAGALVTLALPAG